MVFLFLGKISNRLLDNTPKALRNEKSLRELGWVYGTAIMQTEEILRGKEARVADQSSIQTGLKSHNLNNQRVFGRFREGQ